MVRVGPWGGPGGPGRGRRAALLQTRLLLASVSISGQECQEQQKQAWGSVQRLIKEVKQEIETVKRNVNTGNEIVMTSLPGALADLYWAEFVSVWVLRSWGGSAGVSPSRHARFGGVMDVTLWVGIFKCVWDLQIHELCSSPGWGWGRARKRLPIRVRALSEAPYQFPPVSLSPDISQIKSKLQEISKVLEKLSLPSKFGRGGG